MINTAVAIALCNFIFNENLGEKYKESFEKGFLNSVYDVASRMIVESDETYDDQEQNGEVIHKPYIKSDEEIAEEIKAKHEARDAKLQDDMYERFLRDEEVVHIDGNKDVGYFFSFTELEGKELKLSDIVRELNDYYNNPCEIMYDEVSCIRYVYIDCGNDGVGELYIQMCLYQSGWKEDMIIKKIDGQLKMIYSLSENYYFDYNQESYRKICRNGYICKRTFDEYIDASGKYNLINYRTCYFDNLYGFDKYMEKRNKYGTCKDIYRYDYDTLEYDINNTPSNPMDDIYSCCISKNVDFNQYSKSGGFCFSMDVADEKNSWDAYLINGYADEMGITLLPEKEVVEIINEHNEKNVIDELLSGEEDIYIKSYDWKNLEVGNFLGYVQETDVDYSIYDSVIEKIKTDLKKVAVSDEITSISDGTGPIDFSGSDFLEKMGIVSCYRDNHGEQAYIEYARKDVDGNGVDELIIRHGWSCNMYTIKNGKISTVFTGGYRDYYKICEDGIIGNFSTSEDSLYIYDNGYLREIRGDHYIDGYSEVFESEEYKKYPPKRKKIEWHNYDGYDEMPMDYEKIYIATK